MKYTVVVFLLLLASCGRVLDQGVNSYTLFVEPETKLEEEDIKSQWILFFYLYLGGANWV